MELNLNNIFGPLKTKKKKKKAKKASRTSKSKSGTPPTAIVNGRFVFPAPAGGPTVGTNGRFVFPMTGLPAQAGLPAPTGGPGISPPKSKSKHNSYLVKGTVTAEEIVARIQIFIDTFFKKHGEDKLTVDDLINDSGAKDFIKYMKPMPETVTDEIIGSGGFGNAFVTADQTKL